MGSRYDCVTESVLRPLDEGSGTVLFFRLVGEVASKEETVTESDNLVRNLDFPN